MKRFLFLILFLPLMAVGQQTNKTPINRGMLQSDLDGNGKSGTNFGTLRATNFIDAVTGLPIVGGGGQTNIGVLGITNGGGIYQLQTNNAASLTNLPIASVVGLNTNLFQPANVNLTNFATLGTNTFLNTNDTTNAAYVIANQFSIPSWAEGGGVNFQYTWDTNFANSGAAMIRSQNTNYPIYVTTITPGTGTNFFVKSGRVFYDPTDVTAKYIGFTCSNTPTRIGMAWRVHDQNRAAAVNWIQTVLACSTNPLVLAPGNQGLSIGAAVHWGVYGDLAASGVSFFTNGVGTGDGITLNPTLFYVAPNFATSPLGGRTTVGADAPNLGEIIIQEMKHTPAMGDVIQFRWRNNTINTNDPLVSKTWGRSVMGEVFWANGSLPVSANYELLAMWAGTPPEDLISGQVTMDGKGITNVSATNLTGNAATALKSFGATNLYDGGQFVSSIFSMSRLNGGNVARIAGNGFSMTMDDTNGVNGRATFAGDVYAQSFSGNFLGSGAGLTGIPPGGITMAGAGLVGRSSAGVGQQITVGSGLSLSGTTLSASGSSEILWVTNSTAGGITNNSPSVTVNGPLTVNGSNTASIIYGDQYQTNALVVFSGGIRSTSAASGFFWDSATGKYYETNLTATRVMLTDANKAHSSSSASSGAPIDSAGIAATASGVNGLFPSPVLTNNMTLLTDLTNMEVVTSVSIPPGAWFTNNVADGASLTAASAQNLTNTGDNFVFADSVTNTINGRFDLPWNWDAGTVKVEIRAFCSGTNASVPAAAPTNVVWSVRAAAIGDGDRENVLTWGTAVLVTNGIPTNSFASKAAITGALTVGNTPTTAKSILWQIQRLGAATGDTLTNSSLAISGVRVYYRTLASTNFPVASP